MITGISFTICSLFYIVLLYIVFFSKPRINSLENKLFKYLLVSNIIGIILAIGSFCYIPHRDLFPLVNEIIGKGYIVYLMTWLFLFSLYIFTISVKSIDEKLYRYRTFARKMLAGFVILYMIGIGIILSLPLYYVADGYQVYSYGPCASFMFTISTICIVIWCICLFLNYKEIRTKKYLPLFGFMVLGFVAMSIQKSNPSMVLVTATETFITFLVYFTIENPDLHMIKELNLAKDHAEKANKAKTDFLSSMSHEIRTPLNAIDGFSQVMLEETDIQVMKEEAKDIRMACQNLIELVNGILDISKIEANKLEIVNADYDFHQMLKEVVVLVTARMGKKNLEFRTHFDESVPQILYGDMTRIKQILLNLLTNALKYTKEGYIDFTVNAVSNKGKCHLIFIIEDTGIGIKPTDIDRLFDKFERLEMEQQSTIEGTGLGLAITKNLIEMMGGKIIVHSNYGSGSKFTAFLTQTIKQTAVAQITPLDDLKETYKPSTHPGMSEVVETEIEFFDLSNRKILVVDDNRINLKVIARLLQDYHPIVTQVESGKECIERIQRGKKYDLIFMDDMMPGMSGIETFHQLEKIIGFSTPVIALTANAIEGMKEKYLKEGFDYYLSKPLGRKELHRVLIRFLNNKNK